MFAYYFDLALRSFRRNKALTTLMVLAIALGIGASMTTLTVFHVLSGDPLPGKSEDLYYVQLDPRPPRGAEPGEEPIEQSTRRDAEALVRAGRADRQAMMTGGRHGRRAAVPRRRSGSSAFPAPRRRCSHPCCAGPTGRRTAARSCPAAGRPTARGTRSAWSCWRRCRARSPAPSARSAPCCGGNCGPRGPGSR